MSKLLALMAAKKAARIAEANPVPTDIVDPALPDTGTRVIIAVDPAKDGTDVTVVETKPKTSFLAPIKKTIGALNEISTQLTASLSEAEQKVADQRAAGVYDLPEEATTLIGGTEAEQLVSTMMQLDAALVEKTPEIRTLSREIRKNLEQYPELCHILKEEQLHIMVTGYLTLAGVKTEPKTKAGKTASAKKKADAVLKSAQGKSVGELF